MDEIKDERKKSPVLREVVFVLAAVLIAILGYLAWRFMFYRADYANAAEEIKKSARRDDVTAIFPSWLREEVFTFDGLNVVSPAEGSYVNFYGFGRLWVVIDTKYTPDRFPLKNTVSLIEKRIIGPMSITLYSLPSYNALGHFQEAKVYTNESGIRKPCGESGNAIWRCGPNHWQTVGPLRVEITGQRVDCIWAHPIAGKAVEIELPATGTASPLHIYTAFADSGAGGGYVPPVKFEIRQGDFVIGELINKQGYGWSTNTFRPPPDKNRPITVRITTETEGRQHWCFNIEAD